MYNTCKCDFSAILEYIASEMMDLYISILKLFLGFFFPLKENLINLCLCVYKICSKHLSAMPPPEI